MTRSELDDQTYSLDRALTDVLKAKTKPDQARGAAEWIRRRMAELETKVGYLEHLLTARMRNESQPAPDSFQRCNVSVPKQCVLQRGHGGHSHVSNSGTMWPVLAPDHLPEVWLVRDDEPRCPVRRERDHIPDALCARQWNHGGPHMDRTAIAHAGNAGEVWE